MSTAHNPSVTITAQAAAVQPLRPALEDPPAFQYYRIRYQHPGGCATTVTSARSSAHAAQTFARDNPHVTILELEDEAGALYDPHGALVFNATPAQEKA